MKVGHCVQERISRHETRQRPKEKEKNQWKLSCKKERRNRRTNKMTQWSFPHRCEYCDKLVKESKDKNFHDGCKKKAVKRGKKIVKRGSIIRKSR